MRSWPRSRCSPYFRIVEERREVTSKRKAQLSARLTVLGTKPLGGGLAYTMYQAQKVAEDEAPRLSKDAEPIAKTMECDAHRTLALTLAIFIAACSEPHEPSDPPLTTSLKSCSDFVNLSENRAISFNKGNTAELRRFPAKPDEKSVYGQWAGAEDGRAVQITFGGETLNYTLFTVSGGQVCILAEGDGRATDLTRAWIGSPGSVDPADYDYKEPPDPE